MAFVDYPVEEVDQLERLTRRRERSDIVLTPKNRRELQAEINNLITVLRQTSAPNSGDLVAGCSLGTIIGAGKFGVVWDGIEQATGEPRAIKIFDRDRLGISLTLYHFRRGVRAMRHLTGCANRPPSVVTLLDTEPSGLAFSMPLMAGGDLHKNRPRGWTIERKLSAFRAICDAVAFAHANEVIHRDIKPANVTLTSSGDPVLTDFDIADLVYQKTQSAAFGGTPLYAAPEEQEAQLPGKDNYQGDVFSLGRLLHFLLLEQDPPFLFEPRPSLHDLKSFPRGLVRIVRRCTLKDPAKRYKAVSDLLRDIGEAGTAPGKVGVSSHFGIPGAPNATLVTIAVAVIGAIGLVAAARTSKTTTTCVPGAAEDCRAGECAPGETGIKRCSPEGTWYGCECKKSHPDSQNTNARSIGSAAGSPPPPQPQSQSQSQFQIATQESPRGRCLVGMEFIGGETEAPNSKPGRPGAMPVADFCFDSTEATVASYLACTRSTDPSKCTVITSGCGKSATISLLVTAHLLHPMNCLSAIEAERYCAFGGRRLPTVEEWKWAARNRSSSQQFAWGISAPTTQLCWSGVERRRGSCPIRSFPPSPLGLRDIAGNVWEWTSSGSAETRLAMGGAWTSTTAEDVSSESGRELPLLTRSDDVGVRCARTPLSIGEPDRTPAVIACRHAAIGFGATRVSLFRVEGIASFDTGNEMIKRNRKRLGKILFDAGASDLANRLSTTYEKSKNTHSVELADVKEKDVSQLCEYIKCLDVSTVCLVRP